MLPDVLAVWCETVIGGFVVLGNCSHPHGESQVWRLQSESSGATYYLKAHRRDGKKEREIWAYKQAAPLFDSFAPRLVAVRDDTPSALLLSALPGEPMERVSLTLEQERNAWEKAGEILFRFHSITSPWFGRPDRNGEPMEGTHADAETFWQSRLTDWIDRAERGKYLSPDEIAFARDHAQDMIAFRDEPAVATHHDYTPRNWIVSPETGEWLGAIDFEHTCFDVRVADFKLHQDRFFDNRPDLKEAFFTGYGVLLTQRQEAQLQIMHLHQGVSGVVWSREHNDVDFEASNHAILDRLRREAVK